MIETRQMPILWWKVVFISNHFLANMVRHLWLHEWTDKVQHVGLSCNHPKDSNLRDVLLAPFDVRALPRVQPGHFQGVIMGHDLNRCVEMLKNFRGHVRE